MENAQSPITSIVYGGGVSGACVGNVFKVLHINREGRDKKWTEADVIVWAGSRHFLLYIS